MNQARPWPHPNSVYVNPDIIIVVYNQAGLEDFRRRLQMLPKPKPTSINFAAHPDIAAHSGNNARFGNGIRSATTFIHIT